MIIQMYYKKKTDGKVRQLFLPISRIYNMNIMNVAFLQDHHNLPSS